MKRLLPVFCLGIALLAFASAPLAHAAAAPAPKPAAKPTPPPAHHTVIGSISSDSITVTAGPKSTTYQIDKHTKLFFEGKLVKVDDVKAGMRVTVTPTFDGKTADTISASAAPKATPTPSPAPKK